jgi:hypothetical protein
MMMMISRQLELDPSTVQNYFMNARRRQKRKDVYNQSIRVEKQVIPHVTGDL